MLYMGKSYGWFSDEKAVSSHIYFLKAHGPLIWPQAKGF